LLVALGLKLHNQDELRPNQPGRPYWSPWSATSSHDCKIIYRRRDVTGPDGTCLGASMRVAETDQSPSPLDRFLMGGA